jgi:SanA protein
MNNSKMIGIIIFTLIIVLLLGLMSARYLLFSQTLADISTIETSQPSKVAIVFGAGLRRDGTPTAVLQDRVSTAAKLYFSGKARKILMSGDNRFVGYDEPSSMRDYAIELGVPTEDIVLDFAGRRTYDTCYRARYIFKVSDALVVTQKFHLPRALYLCNMLGVKAKGVSADIRTYSRASYFSWQVRESIASVGAILDIWILKPLPVLGKEEPIFPTDNP